jgi:hypothetical protein
MTTAPVWKEVDRKIVAAMADGSGCYTIQFDGNYYVLSRHHYRAPKTIGCRFPTIEKAKASAERDQVRIAKSEAIP